MQVKVISNGKETIYKGFCTSTESVSDCDFVLLVRQEDVIETYGTDRQSIPADFQRYLQDRDLPYQLLGIFKQVPNRFLWECGDCGSTNIAVESVVVQDSDGDMAITNVCDKGHTCNACGSENVAKNF